MFFFFNFEYHFFKLHVLYPKVHSSYMIAYYYKKRYLKKICWFLKITSYFDFGLKSEYFINVLAIG